MPTPYYQPLTGDQCPWCTAPVLMRGDSHIAITDYPAVLTQHAQAEAEINRNDATKLSMEIEEIAQAASRVYDLWQKGAYQDDTDEAAEAIEALRELTAPFCLDDAPDGYDS